jgi:uncharacterized protein (DUF4415 family)
MKSLSDWERVRKMRDEDIDFSDAPELTDEQAEYGILTSKYLKMSPRERTTYFKKVKKQPISIRLDGFTLEKLRKSGKNWQTRLSEKISKWVDKDL